MHPCRVVASFGWWPQKRQTQTTKELTSIGDHPNMLRSPQKPRNLHSKEPRQSSSNLVACPQHRRYGMLSSGWKMRAGPRVSVALLRFSLGHCDEPQTRRTKSDVAELPPGGCTDGQGHLLKTDQRGMPRPDKEDTGGCDMGAFEEQSEPTCIPLGDSCYGPGPRRCCPAPFPHHSLCSSNTGWGHCTEN
jgi:hypothetical protein